MGLFKRRGVRLGLAGSVVVLLVAAVAFFWWAPGWVERSRNRIVPAALPEISPETQRLHDSLHVVDMHSDTLMWDRDLLVDALQAAGARVHLAHPLGVKAFEYRRVKNDFRDGADLADLPRMGRRRWAGSTSPWAAGGVDRSARDSGVARAGAAPREAGRAAQSLQGRGARGAGQVRDPGSDVGPVRLGGNRAP